MSSSRLHCCHITIGTEFKVKHILEQDELFCCAIISSEIKVEKTFYMTKTSPVAQIVKRLPTMQETRVRSLGREDPLEKEMATHASILAWKTPWTEEPGWLPSMGSQRVGHD